MSAIKADSDQIYDLVDADEELVQAATGFTFTEGPIWHPKDGYLLFSDMPGDVRRKYDPAARPPRTPPQCACPAASRSAPTDPPLTPQVPPNPPSGRRGSTCS